MNHREFSMQNGFRVKHVNENTTNYLKVPQMGSDGVLICCHCLTRFFHSHGRELAADNGAVPASFSRRYTKRLVESSLCALAGKTLGNQLTKIPQGFIRNAVIARLIVNFNRSTTSNGRKSSFTQNGLKDLCSALH